MKSIIKKIITFRNQRDWEQYQDIKDLLLGLNIEVGELQEYFLWKKEDEKIDVDAVENELADIFIFLVYLTDKLDIELEKAVKKKLEIHRQHYPVSLSKGNTKKYTQLPHGKNN